MEQLEHPKVPRKAIVNPFASHGEKEWWYCGVRDPITGCYFSAFFYRSPVLDMARIALFDPASGALEHIEWKGWLGSSPTDQPFGLRIGSKGARYERDGEHSWSLKVRMEGWNVDLRIRQESPCIASVDEQGPARYAGIQYFGNMVDGEVRSSRNAVRFQGALGYAEHSWGSYPRDAAWNWIAVQNESLRLSCMQGVRFQSFSRVGIPDADGCPWTALDPGVVFSGPDSSPGKSPWTIVSDDLELKVEIFQQSLLRVAIPAFVPIFVDLFHHECVVRASGRVRTGGIWRPTGDLFGAMEVHHGTW